MRWKIQSYKKVVDSQLKFLRAQKSSARYISTYNLELRKLPAFTFISFPKKSIQKESCFNLAFSSATRDTETLSDYSIRLFPTEKKQLSFLRQQKQKTFLIWPFKRNKRH